MGSFSDGFFSFSGGLSYFFASVGCESLIFHCRPVRKRGGFPVDCDLESWVGNGELVSSNKLAELWKITILNRDCNINYKWVIFHSYINSPEGRGQNCETTIDLIPTHKQNLWVLEHFGPTTHVTGILCHGCTDAPPETIQSHF